MAQAHVHASRGAATEQSRRTCCLRCRSFKRSCASTMISEPTRSYQLSDGTETQEGSYGESAQAWTSRHWPQLPRSGYADVLQKGRAVVSEILRRDRRESDDQKSEPEPGGPPLEKEVRSAQEANPPLCHFVRDGKECPWKKKCRFSHDAGVPGAPKKAVARALRKGSGVLVRDKARLERWRQKKHEGEEYEEWSGFSGGYGPYETSEEASEHDEDQKLEICWRFRDKGECPHGKDCWFLHCSESTLRSLRWRRDQKRRRNLERSLRRSKIIAPRRSSTETCYGEYEDSWYQGSEEAWEGADGEEEDSRFADVQYGCSQSWKLCRFARTGNFCPWGKACRFSHRKQEQSRREHSGARARHQNERRKQSPQRESKEVTQKGDKGRQVSFSLREVVCCDPEKRSELGVLTGAKATGSESLNLKHD